MDKEVSKVLVIGGVSGIGAAVVEQLKMRDGLYEIHVPEVLRADDAPPMYILDVRDETSIVDYLDGNGPYEYIVYTPGVNRLNWAESLSSESLAADMAVNAHGFALVLGAHARLFGKTALTSAVAITSDAARNPMRGSLSYCSSKAALEMIVRVLAREWMPHTRVNGVAPAVVEDTPMSDYIDDAVPSFRGWTPEQAKAYEKTQLPMGRRVDKFEVAEVVESVLFGPQYQTGSIVHISGGK